MLKALVIDDNESSRKIANYFLSQNHLQGLEADNGEVGLSMILKEEFELIVLDWRMPHMDGKYLMCISDRILNQTYRINGTHRKRIPLVFYTSVKLEDMHFPQLLSFDILAYISKAWPMSRQKAKFDQIARILTRADGP